LGKVNLKGVLTDTSNNEWVEVLGVVVNSLPQVKCGGQEE
jgi:hypothetical protein